MATNLSIYNLLDKDMPAKVAGAFDPMAAQERQLKLKDLVSQSGMRDLQMQKMRGEMADEEAMQNAFRQSGGDLDAAGKALAQAGSYKQFLAVEKLKADKTVRDLDMKVKQGQLTDQQRKAASDLGEFMARVGESATTPEAYAAALQEGAARGYNVAGYEGKWSPEYMQLLKGLGTSIKDVTGIDKALAVQGAMASRAEADRASREAIADKRIAGMLEGQDRRTAAMLEAQDKRLRAQTDKPKAMSATVQKELITTEEETRSAKEAVGTLEQALAVNESAWGFPGAGVASVAGGLLPEGVRPAGVDATQNLDNLIKESALPQLKAIFGGMPTEGERKVLLEMSGSSTKPPAVRKKIFERAKAAAERRIRFNESKAKAIRQGKYFNEQGAEAPSLQDMSNDELLRMLNANQ